MRLALGISKYFMDFPSFRIWLELAIKFCFVTLAAFVWSALGNQFSNMCSIANTRHNMTQSTAADPVVPLTNRIRALGPYRFCRRFLAFLGGH